MMSNYIYSIKACKYDVNVVRLMIFLHLIDDPFKDDPFGKADVAGKLNLDLKVINRQTNLFHVKQILKMH